MTKSTSFSILRRIQLIYSVPPAQESHLQMRKSEVEISFCVIVGNILDHLMDEIHFTSWKLAVLKILTYEVAKNSAEILVTRI